MNSQLKILLSIFAAFTVAACGGSGSFNAFNNPDDSNEKNNNPQPNITTTTTTTLSTTTSTTIVIPPTTTTLPPGACAPTSEIIPGGTIVINDGATGTQSLSVNLKLFRDGETGRMKISDNDKCECGVWERYNENKAWTLPQANSVNKISVQYKDYEGRGSKCVTTTIIHDTLPPVISLTLNPNNSYWAGDATGLLVNVVDAGVGLQSVACKLNGNPTACAAGLNDLVFQRQKAGTYFFEVYAVDHFGQSSTGNITWEMREVPTVPPKIAITLDSANTYLSDGDTKLKLEALDAGDGIRNLVCKLNDVVTACEVGVHELVFPRQAVGLYKFEASAVNAVGKPASASVTWEVKQRPTFAPVIRLALDPSNTYYQGSDTNLKLEILDSGDGVENVSCKLNGVQTRCAAGISNLSFAAQAIGTYTFEASATNRFGKPASGAIAWEIKRKPDQPPLIKLALATTNTYLNGDDTKLFANVIDAGDGVENLVCKLNGVSTACVVGSNTLVFQKQTVGNYKFDVSATNSFGVPASESISWTVNQKFQDIHQRVEIKSNNKVDILIVDDNSASMIYEQQSMAKRMSTFLNQLSGLDWRIAITTTDPYHKTWGDGRLLAMKGLTNQFMITSAMPAQQAQKVLGDTIQRSEQGNASEQGIYATFRAVERSFATAANNNKTFFRSDANFATIVISDEDESAKEHRNIPENLVNYIQSKWASKIFAFHSIITKPGDTKCQSTYGATFGVTYQKMSLLTGAGTVGGAIIGSVCEADYGSQLKGIGDSVQQMQKIINLQCQPEGSVDSAVTVKLNGSNYTAPYQVQGLKLVFASNLPAGQYELSYRCVQQLLAVK